MNKAITLKQLSNLNGLSVEYCQIGKAVFFTINGSSTEVFTQNVEYTLANDDAAMSGSGSTLITYRGSNLQVTLSGTQFKFRCMTADLPIGTWMCISGCVVLR